MDSGEQGRLMPEGKELLQHPGKNQGAHRRFFRRLTSGARVSGSVPMDTITASTSQQSHLPGKGGLARVRQATPSETGSRCTLHTYMTTVINGGFNALKLLHLISLICG